MHGKPLTYIPELTLEFIEQRIREQEEYIKHQENKKKYLHYNTPRLVIPKVCKRIDELIESAQGQLDYFWRKKTDWLAANGLMKFPVIKNLGESEINSIKQSYYQEFEGIMKASTTIIH